jgi:hypothetical protein
MIKKRAQCPLFHFTISNKQNTPMQDSNQLETLQRLFMVNSYTELILSLFMGRIFVLGN